MIVSISQFRSVHKGINGEDMPMGGHLLGSQTLTAEGASNAFVRTCSFIRVATDSPVFVDAYGSSLFLPAGSVEFFPAAEGDTLTVTAAA